MKTKASTVIMSHLSDVQSAPLTPEAKNRRINFVKFLVLKYPDTRTEIDADKEWNEFKEKHPALKDGGILNKKVTFTELFK